MSHAALARCTVSNNRAGRFGGGLTLRDTQCAIEHTTIEGNTASLYGGGGVYGRGAFVRAVNSTFHNNTAGDTGGAVDLVLESRLEAVDTRFIACEAVAAGGAVSLWGETVMEMSGEVLFERCKAGSDGGAVQVAGADLTMAGGVLTVRNNVAGRNGGGVFASVPVTMTNGRADFSDNRAGSSGGGYCGSGYRAQLRLAPGFNILTANNTAAADGGGMALLEYAGLVFEPAGVCPASCTNVGACNLGQSQCMTPQCNFEEGRCSARFTDAGAEALKPCDRAVCPLHDELSHQTCFSGCVVASCDFSASNEFCRPVLEELRSCPLFDLAAYKSITRQQGLTYVGERGSAAGFGRCDAAGCKVPTEPEHNGRPWCTVLDDGGALLQTQCPGCLPPYDNLGVAWGECSSGHPRLPSAGFDYNATELLRLQELPLAEVLQRYPGCGSNPVRFVSNSARRGGGLFRSGYDRPQDEAGRCFIGDISEIIGNDPSLMVLFENNSAASGGGVFVTFPQFSSCDVVRKRPLGLPTEEQHFYYHFSGNTAARYGNDVATHASTLTVENQQAQYVPGQDLLNFTVRLIDSLDSTIDSEGDPYTLQVNVCPTGADQCDSITSIQPTLFLSHDGPALHTAERRAPLEFCELQDGKAAGALRVQVSVSGQGDGQDLAAIVEISCQACPPGHALQIQRSDERALWTCALCQRSEYNIDPNNPDFGCEPCPAGADCDGSSLVGKVAGSRWEPDFARGQYVLRSCPAGHELVNQIDGEFNHDVQRCLPCHSSQYILRPNLDSCQPCPPGLRCNGGSEVEIVVQGSQWVQTGSFLNLTSCPAGYAVLNGDERGFNAELQRCAECPAGQECRTPPCVTCQPCQPGHYKPFLGTDECSACPADTYTGRVGADELEQCQPCPDESTTSGAWGQTSALACTCKAGFYSFGAEEEVGCVPCPVGAECLDGAFVAGKVAGSVWRPDPARGIFVLESCPPGYQVQRSSSRDWVDPDSAEFSHAAQACEPCLPGLEYILNTTQAVCQPCPLGARCEDAHFKPLVSDSVWEVTADAGLRLSSCPAGFIGNRNPVIPELDQCIQCPIGTFSLQPAQYGGLNFVDLAEDASNLCSECPPSATCEGTVVRPAASYWLSPSATSARRDSSSAVALYRCTHPGACLEGGVCAEGRRNDSVVCGICEEGRVLAGQQCRECSFRSLQRRDFVLIVVALSVTFALVFMEWPTIWSMLARNGEDTTGNRKQNQTATAAVRIASVFEPFKIVLSFFQIVSTFPENLGVPWTSVLADVFAWTSISSGTSLSQVPGVSCALSFGHAEDLVARTVVPLVPIACLGLLKLLPRWRDRPLWTPILSILFVTYPSSTVISLQTFVCHTIDGVPYLKNDYRMHCPASDQSWVYWWAVGSSVLFALGTPLLALGVLLHFQVPSMAARKRQSAALDALLSAFQHSCVGEAQLQEDSRSPEQMAAEGGKDGADLAPSELRVTLGFSQPNSADGRDAAAAGASESEASLGGDAEDSNKTVPKEDSSAVTALLAQLVRWEVTADTPLVAEKAAVDESGTPTVGQHELAELLAAKASRLVSQGRIPTYRPVWDGSLGAKEALAIDRVGLVFASYYVDSWFFELWEFWRKFAMTAVIAVIYPGSIEQTQVALCFSIIALTANAVLASRTNEAMQSMQTHALSNLAYILFFGLLLQTRDLLAVPSGNVNDLTVTALEVIGVVLCFSFLLFPLFASRFVADKLRGPSCTRTSHRYEWVLWRLQGRPDLDLLQQNGGARSVPTVSSDVSRQDEGSGVGRAVQPMAVTPFAQLGVDSDGAHDSGGPHSDAGEIVAPTPTQQRASEAVLHGEGLRSSGGAQVAALHLPTLAPLQQYHDAGEQHQAAEQHVVSPDVLSNGQGQALPLVAPTLPAEHGLDLGVGEE